MQQLQVHLENEQRVTFRPDGTHSLADLIHDTQLTGFFKANWKYEDARRLYYSKFPSEFVWNLVTFEWLPRKKQTVYGRLVYIPPNAGEKFYARLVLSVAKNLQSFDDLHRFDGVLYDTIREACLARGLLEDNGEWQRSLDEAKHFQTGFILRGLFVVILRDCLPAEPRSLWNEYKEYICDDLPRVLRRMGLTNASDDDVYNYGLYLVERILLLGSNRTMKDVGMCSPIRDWDGLLSNLLLQDHLCFEPSEEKELLEKMLPSLNVEQRFAFNRIVRSFDTGKSETFFVVGAAGAGKTFLYNTLCHAFRSRSLLVLCVAYSGIAAQLLPGGRTAHSSFKILFNIMDDSVCSIPKNSSLADLLKTATLLIWDECSVQHRFAFEAVDRTLRDLRDCDDMFRGITTILGGDFLHTLPVVKGNLRSPVVHSCLLSSPLWSRVKNNILKLEKNMWVGSNADDQAFAVWLRKLATGLLNVEKDCVVLPDKILCPTHAIEDLITHVYPRIFAKQPSSYFQERCILAPQNSETGEINASVLDLFPGDEHELWAVDHALDPETLLENDSDYSPEVLHRQAFPLPDLF